jgi:excisionase family DNA binding protein
VTPSSPYKEEVGGSSPSTPTSNKACSYGLFRRSPRWPAGGGRHVCVTVRDAAWLKYLIGVSDFLGMAPVLDDQLLSVAEAADYLSMSESTVRRYLRRLEIEHIRVGAQSGFGARSSRRG